MLRCSCSATEADGSINFRVQVLKDAFAYVCLSMLRTFHTTWNFLLPKNRTQTQLGKFCDITNLNGLYCHAWLIIIFNSMFSDITNLFISQLLRCSLQWRVVSCTPGRYQMIMLQRQNYTCHCWIKYNLFILHSSACCSNQRAPYTIYGIITNVSMIGVAIAGECTGPQFMTHQNLLNKLNQ